MHEIWTAQRAHINVKKLNSFCLYVVQISYRSPFPLLCYCSGQLDIRCLVQQYLVKPRLHSYFYTQPRFGQHCVLAETDVSGPFCLHGLTLTLSLISDYIHYKMWSEFTYPFPNFIGCGVKVWEWISNFIPFFIFDVITFPCRDQR